MNRVDPKPRVDVRRRLMLGVCAGTLMMSACEAVPMKVMLDVVVYSYLDPKGTPRNGEIVAAKSAVSLAAPARGGRCLGVHIHPDDTVELVTSQYYPHPIKRGEVDIARLEKQHAH
jgi:hypothetical protein